MLTKHNFTDIEGVDDGVDDQDIGMLTFVARYA
jgi:hypothetical protein